MQISKWNNKEIITKVKHTGEMYWRQPKWLLDLVRDHSSHKCIYVMTCHYYVLFCMKNIAALVEIWLQLINKWPKIFPKSFWLPLRFTADKIVLNNRIPWPHYDGIRIHLLHNLHLQPTVYPCSLNKVFDSVILISEPPLFLSIIFQWWFS